MFGWNKNKKKKKKPKGDYSMRSAFLLGLSEPYEEHMEQEIDPAEMQMEHTTTGALPVEVGLGISLMMPFGEGPGSPMDAPPAVPNPQGSPEEQELFTQLSGLLAEQWGIGSRDALLLTITSLLETAGDPEYDALRPYIQQIASLPVKERDAAEPEIIEAAMNDPQYREIPADELRAALERWMSLYTQEHTEKLIPQQLPQTLAGWDVGRAARLARIGYLVGMINLEEYLNISSHALAATRERCQNWRDHVDQFLLGRAKWQEVLGEDTLDHRDAMWVRLKHPDSVWAKYPLHGNYDA